MSELNRGAVRLRTFLATQRTTQSAVAHAVDVSDVTAHHWLHGRIAPRAERRAAIAAWTLGAVPAESWDEDPTDADLALMRAAIAGAAEPAAPVTDITPTPGTGAAA